MSPSILVTLAQSKTAGTDFAILGFMVKQILLIAFMGLSLLSPEMAIAVPGTCQTFLTPVDDLSVVEISRNGQITESEISEYLALRMQTLEPSRPLASRWLKKFIRRFKINQTYTEAVQHQIDRNAVRTALEKAGIKIVKNPRYRIGQMSDKISLAISLTLNSFANYYSLQYLGTPILVHIPNFHFLNTEKIPADVLNDIITKPATTRATLQYLRYRFLHGAHYVSENLNLIVSAALIMMLTQHYEAITDPGAYMADRSDEISENVMSISMQSNLDLIAVIDQKISDAEATGDSELVAKAKQLKDRIIQQNVEISARLN